MAKKKTETTGEKVKKENLPAETKAEKPAKKAAKKTPAKKAPKTVDAEKLPKMFRKNYPAKKFEKKILRKVFIESDKKLVLSLYEKTKDENDKEIYTVDLSKEVELKNVQRLKIVAKQIKKQKGTVKFVPLFATLIFLSAVGIGVTMFKNVIVKKAIVSAMEGIFRAETNVGKVNFQIFGSSLQVKDLQQTNKDNPKFNLFSIENIEMDFNLTDLLRGKLHAETLAVEGVAIGTERKKEGRLIKKAKDKQEKKTESAIAKNSKEFADKAKDKLTAMFASYNPEVMIKEIQDDLKSPALAKTITEDVQKSVTKWQDTPAKMEKSVNDFNGSVQKVLTTDWNSINDAAALKDALETVNSAITQGQTLSDSINDQVSEIKKDVEKVQTYSNDIQNAIASDRKLIDDKISQITHLLSKDGMTEVMNDAIQSLLYDVTGKYYPYVNQVIDMAKSAAANKPEESESKKASKKAKKQSRERLKGTDIYFKADTVPKLLIDEVRASGYEKGSDKLLFSGNAKNITSDQNMINRNTSVEADFNISGRPNNASIIIDGREKSDKPLLLANYNGKGYPMSANAEVFTITSDSDITAMLSADNISNFTVSGILDMNVTSMTGMEFEPAQVCRIYNNALSGIKYLTLGFGITLDDEGGLSVEIKNMDKLAKQLTDPVVAALSSEVTAIAASAKEEAIKVLSEKTGIASEKIAQFTDISNAAGNYEKMMADLQAQMEAKKKEISDRITAQAKGAVKGAVNDTLKNSGVDADKAKDALKGLKGLKF